MEERLFGGYRCVFASYGPYAGRVRYGDVVFRLDPSELGGRFWASFSSGWYFLRDSRGLDVKRTEEVSGDDIRAFSDTVFTGRDMPAVYPLMIVSLLRSRQEAEKLAARLLSATDGREFYALVDDLRLGYMEAKIDSSVPLSAVTAIELPPALLGEVLSWPEAAAQKSLIRASAD